LEESIRGRKKGANAKAGQGGRGCALRDRGLIEMDFAPHEIFPKELGDVGGIFSFSFS
jgi:hypothetical protein